MFHLPFTLFFSSVKTLLVAVFSMNTLDFKPANILLTGEKMQEQGVGKQ